MEASKVVPMEKSRKLQPDQYCGFQAGPLCETKIQFFDTKLRQFPSFQEVWNPFIQKPNDVLTKPCTSILSILSIGIDPFRSINKYLIKLG